LFDETLASIEFYGFFPMKNEPISPSWELLPAPGKREEKSGFS